MITAGPTARLMPTSSKKPWIWLDVLIRSRTSDFVSGGKLPMSVALQFWGGTNRIDGRDAASQMASASMKLFLLAVTKGRTNCGEISLT